MRARAVLALVAVQVAAAGPLLAQPGPEPIHQTPQYLLSAGALRLSWEDDTITSAVGPQLSIARHVLGPLRVRLSVATVAAQVGADRADARLYDVLGGVELAPPFRVASAISLRPTIGIAIGATVTDPKPPDLVTRSQNSWSLAVGLQGDLPGPWSAGLAYERRRVSLQSLASGPPSSGVGTRADALSAWLGFRF